MASPSELSTPVKRVRAVHSVLYGIAVLVFAAAALTLRLFRFKNVVRVHYIMQITGTTIMFGGFGCGVWMTQNIPGVRPVPSGTRISFADPAQSYGHAHEIVGTLLAAAVFVPMGIGYFMHAFWKKHQRQSWRNPAHVWVARAYIVLMVVNAYLPSVPASLAFGVPCVIALVVYVGVVGRCQWNRRKGAKQGADVVVEGTKGDPDVEMDQPE